MTVGNLSQNVGSTGNDNFSQTVGRVNYGLQGNDSFAISPSTSPTVDEVAVFVGGSGSDTYSPGGSNVTTIILENGNSSGDSIFWPAFAGGAADGSIAQIDGRHLFVADNTLQQYALIIDWQSPSNRIESISNGTQTFTYDQYSAILTGLAANSSEQFDFTWAEAQDIAGVDLSSLGLSSSTINQAIDLVSTTATQLEAPSSIDPLAYIASHNDLIGAFGVNAVAGQQHYDSFGRAEGRTVTFVPNDYLNSYSDLRSTFGTDSAAATVHYIQYGFAEGRTPIDPLTYIASHGDLIGVYGLNAAAGTQHYISFGQSEGRRVTFDPVSYLNQNSDLQAVFGGNTSAATAHYIQYGFAEGRAVV